VEPSRYPNHVNGLFEVPVVLDQIGVSMLGPSDTDQRRFAELVQLLELCSDSDETHRAALLGAADPELRSEVLRLLSIGPEAAGFLDDLACMPPPEVEQVLPAGTRLGAYTLHGCIGEGGAGAVYEAQQDNPPRRVALKLIAGLARRFDEEVRALARMRHPGIVQIYDCGRFPTSQPSVAYLAMELVVGVPITEFASTSLAFPAQLELLAMVCDAVQHAHSHGVIHRDLKPANILVDEAGRPKVLDFGLAKLIEPGPGAKLTAALAGTPAYMSPEQAAGGELDTASDLYTLGVIAFEVLTGQLPYANAPRTLSDAIQIVGKCEPIRPSSLRRELRGDAEAVLLKALGTDRGKRYASADPSARPHTTTPY
jgi:serine/threonine protein kinase